MGRIVHVVCGASAAGTLREVLHRMGITADVAVFPCALRYGALFRDFGDESLRRYAGEVERLTGGCGVVRAVEGVRRNGLRRLRQRWSCGTGMMDERLMYYMVCALAPAAPFFEVDVAAVRPMLKHCGRGVYRCRSARWRMWSGCMGVSCPWTVRAWKAAAAAWKRWRCSDAALRIVSDDDGIAEVAEDFFDRGYCAACGAGTAKAVQVVGEVLLLRILLSGTAFCSGV